MSTKKNLFDTIDTILFFAFIAVLFFLFSGTPDVWDKLHERAMISLDAGQKDCAAE